MFRHLGPNIYASANETFLFPRALQILGWKHCIDLLIRRGLWSFEWFPLFIARLNAVVKFFREYCDVVCADLSKRKLTALSKLVMATTFPTFADWRWSTLDACVKAASAFISSYAKVFDASTHRGRRYTKLLTTVCDALISPVWFIQLQLVALFCSRMTELLSWAGSCICHTHYVSKAVRDACKHRAIIT